MTDEQLQAFLTAIKQNSTLILDSVLPITGMTAGQLHTLYGEIGKHYVVEMLTTPAVGDALDFGYGVSPLCEDKGDEHN